eukprot:3402038-Pleurochrysis_carterae.AAC.1
MTSISNFRQRRNLDDATVTAVTEFCSGMLSRVRAVIERRIKALASTIFANIVASIFEVANRVTSIYMDKKDRESKVPFIKPQRRLMGVRKLTHICFDGRKVESEVHDYCYDQP